MERKKRKYSFDEKEKLARLCAKYKEEYDNHETVEKYDPKKRKFTKSRMSNSSGFLSKAVREMYPSMKEKPSDSPDFKKAIQLARRSYNSYIDEENQENFEPALKKKKFRQTGGGRKSVAVEVRETKKCLQFFKVLL